MTFPPEWAFLRGCNPQWGKTGLQCTACHESKSPDDFYLKVSGQPEAMCKKCRSARALARHHAKKAAANG
jgi:hypothetical protein